MRVTGGLITGTASSRPGMRRGGGAGFELALARLLAVPCLTLFGACSLLVDPNSPQCETDADCSARGASFAGMICEQQLCVARSADARAPDTLDCDETPSSEEPTVEYSFATLLPLSAAGQVDALRIQACMQLDLDCSSPVGGPYEVPAGSVYDFPLPQGFSGFFRIESAAALPALYFLPRPVVTDSVGWSPTVVSKEVLDQLGAAAGVTLDPAAGVIIAAVRDCAGKPLEGVSVSASEPQALRFYIVNNLPVLKATATGTQGVVGFANVPASTVALSATTASGKTFPPVSVRVVPGTLSLVELRP